MDLIPEGLAEATLLGVPLAFVWTSLLIELTPGPNMTYLAVLTLADGRRAGFAAVAGVALGLLVIGVLAALGVAALIAENPVLYSALRWGGVLYLTWLAIALWRGVDSGDPSLMDGVSEPWPVYFKRGLITNLLNPKAAVFYVVVLPSFLDAATVSALFRQTVRLSLAYVSVASLVHGSIVMLAGQARPHLENAARMDAVRRGLALALFAIAVWLAWSTRIKAGG